MQCLGARSLHPAARGDRGQTGVAPAAGWHRPRPPKKQPCCCWPRICATTPGSQLLLRGVTGASRKSHRSTTCKGKNGQVPPKKKGKCPPKLSQLKQRRKNFRGNTLWGIFSRRNPLQLAGPPRKEAGRVFFLSLQVTFTPAAVQSRVLPRLAAGSCCSSGIPPLFTLHQASLCCLSRCTPGVFGSRGWPWPWLPSPRARRRRFGWVPLLELLSFTLVYLLLLCQSTE